MKEESHAAPCDRCEHKTCQFLQPNLERKTCSAVLRCSSIHTCLFDFTLCSNTDPNLSPKKPHRLVWVQAQPVFFSFSPHKNLISCTCHCESCSFMDAAHWNRHHGGKKMLCVSSLIHRISINTGTRGRGSRCCSRMFMLEPCLLADCRYEIESSQLPGSSSAPTPPALQTHQWLLMPHTWGGLEHGWKTGKDQRERRGAGRWKCILVISLHT